MTGELVEWGRLWPEAGERLSPKGGRDPRLFLQRESPSLALPDHIRSLPSPLPFPFTVSGGS